MTSLLRNLAGHRRTMRWLTAMALILPLALQLAFPADTSQGTAVFPGVAAVIGLGGAVLLWAGARVLGKLPQEPQDREANHD